MRHTKVGFVPAHTLAMLMDLPAGTHLIHVNGSFDPPGAIVVMENDDWPEVPDNQEAPRVLLNTEVLRVDDTSITPSWPTHAGDAHMFGRIRLEVMD